MNYAYLDKYGILHLTSTQEEGMVPTNIEHDCGYPIAEAGKDIVVYSLEEAYLGGNRKCYKEGRAKKVELDKYPEIKALYIQCMELKK